MSTHSILVHTFARGLMDGRIIAEASITFPLLARGLDEAGIVADVDISRLLQSALVAFVEAIESGIV